MKGRTIYLARPISGRTPDEVFDYYSYVRKKLGKFYDILHPMTGKDYLRTELEFKSEGYFQPASTNHAIVERDSWMVSQCDILFLDLTDAEFASIGCTSELAWAWIQNKLNVVVLPKGNVHEHAFILEMASVRFEENIDAMLPARAKPHVLL